MTHSVERSLLEHTIIQCWHYINRADNLGLTNDYRDIYFIIDYLSYAVAEAYPQIPCKNGCSGCCSDTGLPRVTQLEWNVIEGYLTDVMQPDVLQKILEQNKQLHEPQFELLKIEEKRIQDQALKGNPPPLECKHCPFLIDQSCAIYDVRPAICRGFGYFTHRKDMDSSTSTIFSCYMAAETLLNSLDEMGITEIPLPVWNKISTKIFELNKLTGHGKISLIPLWLNSKESSLKSKSL